MIIDLLKKPVVLLIAGFGIIITIFTIMLMIGFSRVSSIEHRFDDVVNTHSQQATLASKMIFLARERILIMNKIVTTDDVFERDRLFLEFRSKGAEYVEARDTIQAMELHDDEQELIEQHKKVIALSAQILYEVWDLASDDELKKAQQILFNQVMPVQEKAIAILQHFIHIQHSYNKNYLATTTQDIHETISLMVKLMLLIVLLCMAMGLLLLYRFRCFSQKINESNQQLKSKITTLKQRDEELRRSEARERIIRNSAMNAIVSIDTYGTIESFNPAALEMFGYDDESELVGKNVAILMQDSDADKHDDYVRHYRETGKDRVFGVSRDMAGKRKDGSIFPIDLAINKANIDGEVLIVGVMRDLTRQREAEEALQRSHHKLEETVKLRTAELEAANTRLLQMASYDQLTGLPNRSLLQEHMKLAIAHACRHENRLAILFIDLDGFKQVNDELGHDMGDLLLQEIGNRLLTNVRATDSAARFGGDEFVILLTEVNTTNDVRAITEGLIRILTEPYFINGHTITVGASIGVAMFPQDGKNMNGLINSADQAMYQVKKQGKNAYQFASSQDDAGPSTPHQNNI